MAAHVDSKPRYLETSIDSLTLELTDDHQEKEESNAASDHNISSDVYDHGDDYQGPHDWRRRLKPVQSPIHDEGKEGENWAIKGQTSRTRRNREPLEEVKAQDKPKRVPSWKRHLIEKKKSRINLKRQGSGAGTGSSQTAAGIYRKKSFNRNGESAFTQQVVNGNQARRKISPSNSFKQAAQLGSQLSKNRIAKVQRARLYLLQQAGPNSFLIGGDSPDHKFRVIIGPQTCSCGKGPHCVHLLFVMLRVFQISETDPLLCSKTLKNYEVENLFRVYHDKVSNRIRTKKEEMEEQKSNNSKTPSPALTPTLSEVDAESIKEEDDTCPICLLEMLEGESLLKCESGCGNRLHHHCIAIWFELCRRQHDPLICPLCRARWKSSDIDIKSEHHEGSQSEPPIVPPNTRAPSPQPLRELRLSIPSEYASTAAPWIQVLGEDLVSYFFSRDWPVRETGLKQLSKEILGVLMRGMGEGKTGAVISPDRAAVTHNMLETCCQVLAFACADPVYSVYVASLRTLRTVLSYIPCREDQQKQRLETFLQPVVEAVLIKCTDGNRRTSQLSISTIVELAKGQSGELVIGKEVTGSQGLDSLNYIIKCVTKDYDADSVQWQWLLGRLYVLEKLFDEFHNDLLPRNPPDGKSADEESTCTSLGAPCADISISKPTTHDRLTSIAKFCVKAISNAHMKVSRMARRVFLMVAKFSAHVDSMVEDLEDMLSSLELTVSRSMKKRMSRIINDFMLSEKIVNELSQVRDHRKLTNDSPFMSPFGTPLSTPRCNSPNNVSSQSDTVSEAGSSTMGKNVPLAPPNTPIRARRKCKYEHKMEQDLTETEHKENEEHDTDETFINEVKEITSEINRISNSEDKDSDNSECNADKPSPPPVPPRPSSRRGSYEILQEGPIVSPPHPPPDLINSCSVQSVDKKNEKIQNNQDEKTETPLVNGAICPKEDRFSFNDYDYSEKSPAITDMSYECSGGQDLPVCNGTSEFKMSTGTTEFHTSMSTSEFQTSMSISSDERTLSSDDSLDRSRKRMKQRKCFPTVEQGATSSDEILDITTPHRRSASSNESFVTFKTEVAIMTPKNSPNHTVENKAGDDDVCVCKEEVDREEALALAKAMEISGMDPPKPVVPGLTPTDKEEVITIRIQPDKYDKNTGNDNNGNAPSLYLEGIHWVKGPLLGTGAYSTCYQSRDVKSGVIMAVKQISFCRNSKSEQESVVESVTEEIIMMTRLNHPNVVRILGATKQGCHFNMFVEWMPGGSVAYLLSQYGAFSDNVITSYLLQILRGLAYLHEFHILHRDLKGANLLVDSTGQRLRIGDFGAAARLASQATGAGEFQGQLLGTIAFMAPEVLRGEDYGRACDVWSVGCVIIEMSTTLPPWNAKDVSNHLALIFKIATSMKPPPIPDNLSPPVRDILLRCLEQDKIDRPSAKDLLLHPLFTQYMAKLN